jgi:hypothetical protein
LILAAGVTLQQSRPRATPVRLLAIGFATNWDGISAVVQLTNDGPRSIRYFGDPNVPMYSYRFDPNTNWCPMIIGSGVRINFLRAGESVDFHVLRRDALPEYQIEVSYLELDLLDKFKLSMPCWISSKLPQPRADSVLTPTIKRVSPLHAN